MEKRIDASDEVPVARQRGLAQVARATVYAQRLLANLWNAFGKPVCVKNA
jgi:pyruvate kinase